MQGWQSASILSAREGHTATLLHDGRVLVHGGFEIIFPPDGGEQINILRTAELYHPDTNEWIQTASTFIQRVAHTATLLPDGSVLVVGGGNFRFNGILETEIYNPSSQSWSFTRRPLNFPRQEHAATPLQDGKVLVAGGLGGVPVAGLLSSTEIFDPTTQEWTAVGNLNKPKFRATATLLSDGTVVLVGGFDTSDPPHFSVELFNPATLAWTPAEDLLSGSRWGHTATRLSDGKVLVAGGARVDDPEVPLISCEIFDPVTGHWAVTGNLNKPRMGHTATLLPGGNVMVVGGGFQEGNQASQRSILQTPEFFNPTEGWIEGPAMSVPRSGASQTLLRRDLHGPLEIKVLVAGGRSSTSTNTLDSAELFTSGEVVE
jgi:Kelch motif/Galactose oxidase, central domain